MRLILALFPVLLLAKDGFDVIFGFGLLLNSQNLLIAAAMLLVVMRAFREGQLRLELPLTQACFVTWIFYAIVTWYVAAYVIGYERYSARTNAILLKTLLVDHFLVFLVFFYGPRTQADVRWGLNWLLAVIVVSHAFTFGFWAGLVPEGLVAREMIDYSGRYSGLISQPNQYGLLTAALLPAIIALVVVAERWTVRLAWSLAAVLAVGAFGVVASRGAAVAAVLAAVVGAYLFRRQLSAAFLLRFGAIALAVTLGIGVLLASSQYGEFLYDRVFDDTMGVTGASALSKGRTDWWLQALDKMADTPITFLTGFGWRAYYALPHVLAPHNAYLDLWFNLGIPGLGCLLLILGAGLKGTTQAVAKASTQLQPQLMAATIGITAAAVGLFFAEWYQPWLYFWMYFGLVMRMTLLSESSAAESRSTSGTRAPVTSSGVPVARRDAYGWVAGDQ